MTFKKKIKKICKTASKFGTIVFPPYSMKKILLSCFSLALILVTIHLMTPSYGGLLGVWHRAQWHIVTYYAKTVRDPGACGLIRGYWWRSIHEKLRDTCVSRYIQAIVKEKSDCHVDALVGDMSQLSHFWLGDEYRYTCLIRHYQAMLWNSLTREWLPQKCLDARDKLVILQHNLQDVRLSRITGRKPLDWWISTLSPKDISIIEQCEWFLDTPQIYAFLRDDAYTEAEAQYVEAQKRGVYTFR